MGHSERWQWPSWHPEKRGPLFREGTCGYLRFIWLLLAGALLCGESRAQGIDSASEVSKYHAWLGQIEHELRTLADSSRPSSEWSERLRRLPSLGVGTTARERSLPWRTAWLSEGVASILLLPEGETAQRRAEILQLADQTARLRQMIWVDPAREAEDERVRARLERILADPVYQRVPSEEPDLLRQLWGAIRLRLVHLLDDLLGEDWRGHVTSDAMGTDKPVASPAVPMLRILIGLGVSAILLFSARRLLRVRRARRRFGQSPAEPGTREVLGEILADGVQPDELVGQAERLAAEEDFRTATRLVYLATLIHLADLGMITLHPAISNRDYVQSLRHQEEMASLFVHLTIRFEEAWYGNLPTGRADFEDCRQSYTTLAAAASLRRQESRP
ncbi:MAG: DUF4129 domain-containing protein [Blastocatellia bacterium]|jgi:hypothetical protein